MKAEMNQLTRIRSHILMVHEEIGTDRTRKISVEIHFNMKQPHMQE